jgi:hypothetical protein
MIQSITCALPLHAHLPWVRHAAANRALSRGKLPAQYLLIRAAQSRSRREADVGNVPRDDRNIYCERSGNFDLESQVSDHSLERRAILCQRHRELVA